FMRELALIFFRRQIAIASAAALGVPLVAGALEPEAFAVGWPLELPIAGDVVDVPLTREGYENIDGAEQIAILDAGGVPVSFFRISPGPGAVEQRARLSASPLFAAAADALAADVAISSAGDETRVRVVPGPGRADDALTGFLLDARAI